MKLDAINMMVSLATLSVGPTEVYLAATKAVTTFLNRVDQHGSIFLLFSREGLRFFPCILLKNLTYMEKGLRLILKIFATN